MEVFERKGDLPVKVLLTYMVFLRVREFLNLEKQSLLTAQFL